MSVVKRKKISKITKLDSVIPIEKFIGIAGKDGLNGRDGKDGRDGAPGRDGKDGLNGPRGVAGPKGKDGLNGISGHPPTATEVAEVLKEDEAFVASTKGKDGQTSVVAGGLSTSIHYEQVLDTTYTVRGGGLIDGLNIFGVNTGADTTIYLPTGIRSTQVIAVKDESGTAGAFNITVEVLT